MAKITPFYPIQFNPNDFHDLSSIISPPYDAISEKEAIQLRKKSPYNFTHIILPNHNDEDYTHSKNLLKEWLSKGILVESKNPCYFLYRQTFNYGNKNITRNQLLCTIGLEPFERGVVKPHEKTHESHREDRLRILKATGCQLSPIFAAVSDPERYLEELFAKAAFERPVARGLDDAGTQHTLWEIEKDPAIASFFESKSLYILDGHHRYTSNLHFAQSRDALEKWDLAESTMLCAIVPSTDPGLLILPTHRKVLKKTDLTLEALEKVFQLLPMDPEELAPFTAAPTEHPSFALWFKETLYRCMPLDMENLETKYGAALAKVPVMWSDILLIEDLMDISEKERVAKIEYERDWKKVWEARQASDTIVFHAPLRLEEVMAVCDSGHTLPQKSTYFYPKIACGLGFRRILENR